MAAKVTFELEGQEAKAVQAFLRLQDAARKAEGGVGSIGTRGQKASQDLEGGFDKAAGSIARMAAGMVSFGAGVSLIRQYVDYLNQVRELQGAIGEQGLNLQRTIIPLAEQLNQSGRAGLLDTLRGATETAQAGSIPIEAAGRIRQAALSRIINTSQANQLDVAAAVAKAIGKTGGSAEQGEALVQLLSNIGVKSGGAATQAIAQIQAGLLASDELSVGTFAESMTKGGTGLLSLGARLPDIIGYIAQARKVSATPDEASELLRMVSRNVQGNKAVQEIIAGQRGVGTDALVGVNPVDQMQSMQAAIEAARAAGGPAGVARLLQPISEGRVREQILRFFSPAAIEQGTAVRANLQTISPDDLQKQWDAFAGSDVATAQRLENDRQLRRAEEASRRFRTVELNKEAKARLEEFRARGGKDFWLKDKFSFDETLLDDLKAQIQAERLGLVMPGGDPFRSGFGQTGTADLLADVKGRLGISEDQPILELGDLNTGQRRRLAEILRGRGQFLSAHGAEREGRYATEQAERIGGGPATKPSGQTTTIHVSGDFYARPGPGPVRVNPAAPATAN